MIFTIVDKLKQTNRKPKPPIAAQVFFALSVIFALGVAVTALSALTSPFGRVFYSPVMVLATTLVTAGGSLLLAWYLRQGKKWALATYTIIIGLTIVFYIIKAITASAFPIVQSLITVVIIGAVPTLLLNNLWTRHRAYFS